MLGIKCDYIIADKGYSGTADLKKIDEDGITPIVSLQRNARQAGFDYNKENNTYTCPDGHISNASKSIAKKQWVYYYPKDRTVCSRCNRFGTCTQAKYGRTVSRSILEPMMDKLAENCIKFNHIYKKKKREGRTPIWAYSP